MDCGNLNKDRFFPFGRFLEAAYELLEILDTVNIVVRRRADSVTAHRDHPGYRHFGIDFLSRQVTANPGSHPARFDLDRSPAFEVVDVYAKSRKRPAR